MVAIDLLATTKDNLPSYGAWSGNSVKKAVHRPGEMRENNRAGNSYPAILRRERKQEEFKSPGSARRLLATQAPIYNTPKPQPHLIRGRPLAVAD